MREIEVIITAADHVDGEPVGETEWAADEEGMWGDLPDILDGIYGDLTRKDLIRLYGLIRIEHREV